MKHVRLLATAAILALAAPAAIAQVNPGWYLGLGAGLNQQRDTDLLNTANKSDWDLGYAVLGEIGYQFGAFRLGFEPGWRKNDLDSITGPGITRSAGDGEVFSGMLNIYKDFLPESRFNPYIGVGVGVAQVKAKGLQTNGAALLSDGSDSGVAWQGIVGATYSLTQNWALDLAYRYFDAGNQKYRTVAGAETGIDYRAHTVTAGIVYRFGAPPPPPPPPAPAPTPVAAPAPPPAPPPPAPPPPAPAVPNVYIVFFAFDRAEITPVAAQVLDRAIADYRATGSTAIRIEGHADRSGSDAYNQRLSQRRADAVRAYLTTRGLPTSAISTEAFGESRPRVPTPDGVRNDENRRAEIYLRR